MLIWPATRFVAGEHRDEAVAAAEELNRLGIAVSLDLLGENVDEREAAAAARDEYVDLLKAIADRGVDANISIKLTMLGLDIERKLALDHLLAILEVAEATGNWVRIDMESSRYVQLTLELFERAWETHKNVGVVLQAMLRRTAEDVERMIGLGARVRLCKGAYREPAPLALQDKAEVNARFDELAERLLADGHQPAIATHDDARIDHALAFAERRGIAADRFELQMLYGLRRATQVALVERGYRMRVYVPYGDRWLPYFTRRLRERRENVAFVVRGILRG